MDNEALTKTIQNRFGDALEEVGETGGDVTAFVKKGSWLSICRALHDESELDFKFLSDLTCVHWPDREPEFDVVINLLSHSSKQRLRLKCKTDDKEPIDSLTPIWMAADWHEREAFDMFGVKFRGHPDLRRILMPDDYPYHPLRKDFPLEGNMEESEQVLNEKIKHQLSTWQEKPTPVIGIEELKRSAGDG